MKKFKLVLTVLMFIAIAALYMGCSDSSDAGSDAGSGIVVPLALTSVEGGNFTHRETPGTITLRSFDMSTHEITQAQWYDVMGTGNNPVGGAPTGNRGKGDDYPIYYVNWYDAIEFCNALSIKEGITPYYTIDKTNKDTNNSNNDADDPYKWKVTPQNNKGYRLPTEVEWEYAARDGTPQSTNKYAGTYDDAMLKNFAWYDDNSDDTTYPVGGKTANALGLKDMSGNVWEWCWDWYGKFPSGTDNPTGAESGAIRVRRGGSFDDEAYHCEITYSSIVDISPNRNGSNIGFRIVRSR